MSGNYGSGDGGQWPPAGNEPQWDDSVWQQDQPSAWTGQEGAQPGYDQQPPYDGQGYDGQGYDGRGYGGQDYDQGQGQGHPGQGYGGQAYGNPGYDGRSYGQPDPRTGPGYPPPGPGTGPQQYPGGAGGQPAQRGTGPRRAAGGGDYPSGSYAQRGDNGYGQGGYQGGQRDDSFLPGFGPRDDFDGGGQYEDPRRRRRARGDDPRRPDGRTPDGRAPEFQGPDQRGRGDGRRPRGDDRDPRGPGRGNGNGMGGGNGRDDDLDREAWSQYRGEKRRRSPIRRLAPWIALLVIVIPLAYGGWHVWGIYQAKVHPADYTGAGTTPTVTVQVPSGATPDSLAPTLLQDGVIASTRAFTIVAGAAATGVQLEPGYFVLKSHMQASLAWAYLTNPKNMLQTVVTIPEGKRASQVIAIVAKETKIPLKDFQAVLDHPSELGLPSYAKGKVEGYLFPATYAIVPHETALQILQAMVARFNQEAQTIDLPAAAQRVGLTPTQVIIEASMAQAEGGSVSDYPKIARVIINRINAKMPLQFDSVLLYGLNAYAINVTEKQIHTPGPYNDWDFTGLPPGPISNPGDAAIQGILHPATGDWLYFLTVTGGKSEFSAGPLKGEL
jgi:uncharacterized YceG family protein